MPADIHTHVFPPRGAPKAAARLAARQGRAPAGSGRLEDLLSQEAALGVDTVCVLCAAADPSQVRAVNAFARSIHAPGPARGPRVLAFGTAHPADPRWEEELERLRAAGLGGLKLHPDLQGFSLDDPRLDPLLEACRGRFCVLVHAGSGLPEQSAPSSPRLLRRLLDRHPDLDLVAAHLGGMNMWRSVPEAFSGVRNDHFRLDCSGSLLLEDTALLRRLLRLLGPGRCAFGSDWPLFSPSACLEDLAARAGLGASEIDGMLSGADELLDRMFRPR